MNLASDRGRHAAGASVAVSTSETEALARARVEQARMDILLDHPYFASAMLRMPMLGTADPECTSPLATDGRRIVFRHDMIAARPRPEVRLMLMHALAHTLLRHPERGAGRSWPEWTLACDMAVQALFESTGMVTPRAGAAVPPQDFGATAEAFYARLTDRDPFVQQALPRLAPPGDGIIPPEPPGDALSEERRSHGAFARAAGDADAPTALELEGLARAFASDAKELAVRCGRAPGDATSDIEAAQHATVPWRIKLARFLNDPVDRTWSMTRPNRKHLWRGLYLPGQAYAEGGRFVVAIDTSGSMSDAALGCVLGEIDAIRRSCASELTLLQFDASLHAKAEFTPWNDQDAAVGSTKLMRVHGRGGTDIRIPFEWAEKERTKGRRISALIVCTDGFGPLPKEAPEGIPVLFLLTPSHHAPSFGERIVLPPDLGRERR